MKLSSLALLLLAAPPAMADYVVSDFEVDPGIFQGGTLSQSYPTSGSNSLCLVLPASDMWYYSATIIEIGQLGDAVRQAAFSTATKLIIDFTYLQYAADWHADHDVGFILQGTGEENNWVELSTVKMSAFNETTTAEIPISPAQAAILASDPAARLFLFAHYGNGNSMSATVYLDTFRTDADGTFSLPLTLMDAHLAGASSIALRADNPVDLPASAGAIATLQSSGDAAYGAPQAVTLSGQGANPDILMLATPTPLVAGNTYTLSIEGLVGEGGETQPAPAQFDLVIGSGVDLSVDSLVPTHRISPFIYGMSYAPSGEYIRRAGITVNRWGGNATSAFNWELNVTNLAADWYYLNAGVGREPEDYIADNAAGGALTQWSLASLPWVAKDDHSYSFSVAKYGAQEAVEPYHSDIGNGLTPAGDRIVNDFSDALVPNRPRASPGDDPSTVYQDAFLQAMEARLGGFTRKVPFIAIDNEVDIWNGTHADARHSPMTYEDIRDNFTSYATMIREEIPDAQIFGPVSTGWFFYWNSAQSGERASKGMGLIPWFLKEVKAHDELYGERTLDVLDLHFYPEAGATSNGDPQIDAWRMRATREWWDPAYQAEGSMGRESWWAPGEPNPYNLQVIPRMRTLIDTYYPGTQLGFTEWSWGDGLSAALATADTLGIFGAEGIYYSTIWSMPPPDDPIYQAFCLFRNPDDSGRAFGSLSLPTTAPNVDAVSLFASLGSRGDRLHLILLNKDRDDSRFCTVQLPAITPAGGPEAFGFDEYYTDRIVALPSDAVSLAGNSLSVVMPPFSAVHVIVPIVPVDSDGDDLADVWENLYADPRGPISAMNPALADAETDNDGDGFTNREEFLAGTDPLDAGSHPQYFFERQPDGSYLMGAFAPYDRVLRLQTSADMEDWATLFTVSGSDGWVEVSYPLPASNAFVRAVIE